MNLANEVYFIAQRMNNGSHGKGGYIFLIPFKVRLLKIKTKFTLTLLIVKGRKYESVNK